MPILDLFGMVFEWHDDKFELVHQNRGVSLEEVASVFFDDYSIDKDDFGDYDEQRTLTIGMSNQARLLVVVWTQRENIIRIIGVSTEFGPYRAVSTFVCF